MCQATGEKAAGDLPKDGEQNVDEKVGATATLKEDSERREDDGKDDLADVAVQGNMSKHLTQRGSTQSS